MTEDSHIIVKNLNVWYGGNHVLKNINARIPAKGITSIIGPSGCGKTTLLKSFNRLLDLAEDVKIDGEVLVDGSNIFEADTDVTELRKRIGMLTQTPTPLPMNIYDNVAYGPRIHALAKDKLDERIKECLQRAGLWDEVEKRLKDPAANLSLGQLQRLALARALSVEPEVLLCDEPTSALDPISAKHVEEQLLSLKKDYTILFVTHTLRQAKRISDYVIFMFFGELVEFGSAEEFFKSPKDERTKAYLEGLIG